MKKTLFFILFILSFINSCKLSANEKESIPNSQRIQPEKSSFSFAVYNKTNDDKFYQRKANGFLAMGITGIIFTSLALPAFVAGLILALYGIGIFYELSLAGPILLILPFLGIGLPFWIIGISGFNKYKNAKVPDPFKDNNSDNKISFDLIYKKI